MSEETPYGSAEILPGGERLLHERMRELILREREALLSYREERRRAMRTRFVLLGVAVILAATTVLMLFSSLEGWPALAADTLLLVLAAAVLSLFILSNNNVRAGARRLDALKRELAAVEYEIEAYHSAPPESGPVTFS